MISFILNEQLVNTDQPGGLPLLDFIRYDANLRGTKIGCREGDCGACTILIGKLKDQEVVYKSATSCITPLANVNGQHVVTVEGLSVKHMNTVQKVMVECSATQCGFCTPGFVTSLSGYALNKNGESTLQDAISSIDGNICRCTGYKSIERATEQISTLLDAKDHELDLEWLIEQNFIPSYFVSIKDRLQVLKAPKTEIGTKAIGGGTDLFVQKHDEMIQAPLHFLSLEPSYQGVTIENNTCIIKGSATATDLIEHPVLNATIPNWHAYMKLISSTPIRNIGTITGNLVNASPIGDFSILLLALQATITLENSQGHQRSLPLHRFFKAYKVLDKTQEEIITAIKFELPNDGTSINFEKVCKRKFLDIATVNSAIRIHTSPDGTVLDAHVSMGGVGPLPMYLQETSSWLQGKTIHVGTLKKGNSILQEEISPISDVRGSADYKRLLARQLFYSHFIQIFANKIQLEKLV